jgi:hypothetical protein
MAIVFHASMVVPISVEESIPTVRKIAGLKCGIAGTKREKYLAAKALETKKSFVKAKKFCAVGPLVLSFSPYRCRLYTMTDYPNPSEQDTPLDTGKGQGSRRRATP